MKNALSFVPTIRPNLRRLRIPFLSLTPFAHRYPSQTLLRLKIYQKLFFTHMHNWLSLYICRKNTYQSAVIRSISKCLAPKFASLFTASESNTIVSFGNLIQEIEHHYGSFYSLHVIRHSILVNYDQIFMRCCTHLEVYRAILRYFRQGW